MIRSAFLQGFDWSGRARRSALWAFVAFAGCVLSACAAAEIWLSGKSPQAPRFVYLLAAVMAVPLISLGLRRLHDRGHAGGWLVLGLVPVVGWALWLYLLCAPTHNRADAPETPPVLHIMGSIMAGLVVVLVASRMLWAPYLIPSGSMKPGLLVGDYVMVGYAGADDLRRGDVVVFRDALRGNANVARLIGLPGDTVQMRAGQIVLNSVVLAQDPLTDFTEVFAPQGPLHSLPRCGNAPVGAGGQCVTTQLQETLQDGRRYSVLDLMPNGPEDDTGIFTVPPDGYFMLGDNRDDSADSRFAVATGGMGFVAGNDIIGKANRVLFSAEGSSLLAVWRWRAGRYFWAVQ